ncbi:MAG: putative photosynthetic complex assembly protein PuhE [Pseudomonadota bacterium]
MMSSILPVLFCVFAWWLGTGLVLRLDQSPDRMVNRNRLLFTLLAVLVVIALFALRHTTSVWSAYVGFVGAIVLWGWLEYLYYSGCLIGPRVTECPPNLTLSKRFVYAFGAMFYRELSVAIVGISLWFLSWGSPNSVAFYTYSVLWVMRVSAELNVFFGVGYLPVEWLPDRLKYLMSYRSSDRTSPFFPMSLAIACFACFAIFLRLPPSTEAFGHTTGLLITTLLCLAIVEHILLVVPNNGSALWAWAMNSRGLQGRT